MINNKIKGKSGEGIATAHLKSKGYEILERNYTTDIGEIDIIAAGDGFLVFVEVKERYNDRFGNAADAVDYRKRRKINEVASQYIKKYRLYNACVRFDVVEVYYEDKTIRHIENAFDSYLRF